jgi:GNAT superfamily N-acetyltransferase
MITDQSSTLTDAAPPQSGGKMLPPGASSGKVVLVTPGAEEWTIFAEWARAEGWRVPARELSLYRNELADAAFVLRDDDAAPLGFITICCHRRSGWIGNLIVDPARRGEGFGRRLFAAAAAHLAARGAATLWLTASASGLPLYERCGFSGTGHIERWVWQGRARPGAADVSPPGGDLERLVRADALAWGDSRAGLLTLLARGGRVLAANDTLALLQDGEKLRILGPWLSPDLCPRANRLVLAAAMEACAGGEELAVDLLAGSPVRMLLAAAGFRQTGETVLMMRGAPGPVRFGEIVALASLGSMG